MVKHFRETIVEPSLLVILVLSALAFIFALVFLGGYFVVYKPLLKEPIHEVIKSLL